MPTKAKAAPPPSSEAPKEKEKEKESPLTDSEVRSALHLFLASSRSLSRLQPSPRHPVLPVPGRRNVLVTSALPYVNNVPHLGNITGSVLSADVFARFCRIRDERTEKEKEKEAMLT